MPTVLIVEDDPDLRELMGMVIQHLGYEIASAENGIEGLKMVRSMKPDLLILDLMMPTAGGDLTLGYMRSTESMKHIPVIVISAHPTADTIGGELGAQATLRKPFDMQKFRQLVQHYLNSATPSHAS